jgi:plastocyanin
MPLKEKAMKYALSLLALTVVACGRQENAPPASAKTAAKSEATPSTQDRGTPTGGGGKIVGRITLAGATPQRKQLQVDHDTETCAAHGALYSEDLVVDAKTRGVKDAVVWIEVVKGGKEWSKALDEVQMDQEGCTFRPHVAVMKAGGKIKFLNSDPVLHNVNSFPENNPPITASILAKGQGRPAIRTVKNPDTIKITCDAHKWMSAWVIVRDNPYFALTDAEGRFEIDGIPPGNYELRYWHETLGTKSAQVTVRAGDPTEASSEFTPKK